MGCLGVFGLIIHGLIMAEAARKILVAARGKESCLPLVMGATGVAHDKSWGRPI